MAILATACFNSQKPSDKLFSYEDEKIREIDKIAFALGEKYASNIQHYQFDKKTQEYFVEGFQKSMKNKGKIDDKTTFYTQKIDQIAQENRSKVAIEKKSEGKDFIEKLMKEDPDFRQTESGLVYKIIKKGSLVKFSQKSFVDMRFESSYLDGKIYESAVDGNPLKLPLKGIFPAWVEAFSLCGVGCEIEIYAPSDLTYGDNGALPYIKPGETLRYKLYFIKFYN